MHFVLVLYFKSFEQCKQSNIRNFQHEQIFRILYSDRCICGICILYLQTLTLETLNDGPDALTRGALDIWGKLQSTFCCLPFINGSVQYMCGMSRSNLLHYLNITKNISPDTVPSLKILLLFFFQGQCPEMFARVTISGDVAVTEHRTISSTLYSLQDLEVLGDLTLSMGKLKYEQKCQKETGSGRV